MPRDIYTVPEVMLTLQVIRDAEEDGYSDIPGWDGTVLGWSDKAIKIRAGNKGEPLREVWLPVSQLRKAGDGQSVYASVWILDQKGLG